MRLRRRFHLLALALVLALLAPFRLYFALQNGLDLLAALLSGLVIACFGLAVWAG